MSQNNLKQLGQYAFKPNMAVKGTCRPLAVVNLDSFFGFADFVNLCHPARPLLLRYASCPVVSIITDVANATAWFFQRSRSATNSSIWFCFNNSQANLKPDSTRNSLSGVRSICRRALKNSSTDLLRAYSNSAFSISYITYNPSFKSTLDRQRFRLAQCWRGLISRYANSICYHRKGKMKI